MTAIPSARIFVWAETIGTQHSIPAKTAKMTIFFIYLAHLSLSSKCGNIPFLHHHPENGTTGAQRHLKPAVLNNLP